MSDEKNYSVFVNHPSGDPDITPRTILHSTDSIKEARDYIQIHRQGDGILAKVMHTVGPERRAITVQPESPHRIDRRD